jgi:hypothetical protein
LKRQIQEECNLVGLSKKDQLRRAHEILNSSDVKQAICNRIVGASFRDIERTMRGIINERQPSEEEQEMLEIMKSNPEKINPDVLIYPVFSSKKHDMPRRHNALTMEETRALLELGNKPIAQESSLMQKNYPTYTQEQVQQLMAGTFSKIMGEREVNYGNVGRRSNKK